MNHYSRGSAVPSRFDHYRHYTPAQSAAAALGRESLHNRSLSLIATTCRPTLACREIRLRPATKEASACSPGDVSSTLAPKGCRRTSSCAAEAFSKARVMILALRAEFRTKLFSTNVRDTSDVNSAGNISESFNSDRTSGLSAGSTPERPRELWAAGSFSRTVWP